jgi:hypothetical protein
MKHLVLALITCPIWAWGQADTTTWPKPHELIFRVSGSGIYLDSLGILYQKHLGELDTSRCTFIVTNRRSGKVRRFYNGWEITQYNHRTWEWVHVGFLKPNGKRLRNRKNQYAQFIESKM